MARVLMFGALQDLAGWREREIDAPSLSTLKTLLAEEDGVLGRRLWGPGVFTIVNHIIQRDDVTLSAGDEVAFAPPVSGG